MITTTDKQFLTIDKLQAVLQHLKDTFVGKDEIIDLMGICLVGRENLFLLGPPGTAKSATVRELAKLLDGQTFEYLLTRFTEPNELFGPFDIRKLREGELVTNTEGMLPEASLIFLDELLNANSAILNSLLMVLNEKIFRRGRETRQLPALMVIGASNHLPEDEALQALFDRFLIRVRCDNVEPQQLNALLNAGWMLEQKTGAERPSIGTDEIRRLQQYTSLIDLQTIRPQYIELIQQLRNAGLQVSDRRAVKLQRLIAASALICKRQTAIPSDLWVLRHIWDTEEQREVISNIVNTVVDMAADDAGRHPRALLNALPDADEIYSEVQKLSLQWAEPETTLAERSLIKDRLSHLNSRCDWIGNEEQRKYVQAPIDELWKQIVHTA
ncbi:AAA family ATPase [Mucilaginibacter paludis]|uniref:ATPase associated with various cellular activities AAA_5 n=1 Tax=Mucilaginibacter paludis DSM 18603 TaxID=714943 RepID=H1YH69_9SPHI|nr:AAA family ATPase [Mucilaginibacter paludis]EHQ24571.1 ATPase associated with various cellular activities AAA_5 [Mucilaginibacter paludis DSM 18603]